MVNMDLLTFYPVLYLYVIAHPGHYSIGDFVDVEAVNYLRIMHYDIYYDFCVTMSYKTWPFKTVFDLHVMHVFESGIQKYWELMVFQTIHMNRRHFVDISFSLFFLSIQSLARHTDMKIQLGISISRDRPKAEPVRLKLDHVSGAFILFTLGCICATIFHHGANVVSISKEIK